MLKTSGGGAAAGGLARYSLMIIAQSDALCKEKIYRGVYGGPGVDFYGGFLGDVVGEGLAPPDGLLLSFWLFIDTLL